MARALPFRLTPAQRRRLLRWFLLGLSATRVAQETRLGREQVALGGLLLVHQAMVRDVPPALSGVVEIDETSLGGAWRNKRRAARAQGTKRGRGTTKRAVFGILCRGGQVWAAVVPNVEEKTLLLSSTTACNSTPSSARTPSPATLGLQRGGYVHRLVDHRQVFSDRHGSHVNGLEGFWGYLKRRLAAKGSTRHPR